MVNSGPVRGGGTTDKHAAGLGGLRDRRRTLALLLLRGGHVLMACSLRSIVWPLPDPVPAVGAPSVTTFPTVPRMLRHICAASSRPPRPKASPKASASAPTIP